MSLVFKKLAISSDHGDFLNLGGACGVKLIDSSSPQGHCSCEETKNKLTLAQTLALCGQSHCTELRS